MSDELLDRLAELARAQRPSALADEDADAMIAGVLASRSSDELTRPAELKRVDGPRAGGSTGVEAEPGRGTRAPRWTWALAMAAVVSLALAAGHRWGESNVQPDETPLRAELATGDVITAMPGARFELRRVDSERREIAVHEGVALFDVQPLEQGERFEVALPHAVVHVRGTVFSVDARDDSVRVYEGEVEIVSGGRSFRVRANGMWRAGQERTLQPGPLATSAASAVEVREERATTDRTLADRARVAPAVRPGPPEVTPREALDEVEEDELEEAAPATDAPPLNRRRARPTRSVVRHWLATGEYERARATAHAQGWSLLEADALRALGRFGQAADAYDVAARSSDGSGAAFAAARIRFRRLNDAEGALRSLDASPGEGALGERALGLRTQLLHELGRHEESSAAARTYLQEYPEGGLRTWMRSVLEAR